MSRRARTGCACTRCCVTSRASQRRPRRRYAIRRDDLLGALACFWLVVIATIPAVVPFVLFDQAYMALRVSNAVLVALLFVAGAAWGRHAGVNRWRAGLIFLSAGLIMVLVAIALGG